MGIKRYQPTNVLEAARSRIAEALDSTEKAYVAFSGGKDSSVMFHLVMEQAIPRKKKVAVMYIDFEAQYADTITHVTEMFRKYAAYIDQHWICIPMLLRNAVTNYEPRWMCWDPDKQSIWMRQKPLACKTEDDYDFALPGMEFEEFIVLFGEQYGEGANSGALYVEERGNICGYDEISLPAGHTWRSFANLLLQTMPQKTREHYLYRFKKFICSWHDRGYQTIPDESPPELEAKCWAPSWRRMCKVLLRNDWWCHGLGQAQPKSAAYQKFKEMRAERKKKESITRHIPSPQEIQISLQRNIETTLPLFEV